jgi:RarD protein
VRHRRKVLYLVGADVAITVNWAGFIWGVNHGHVVEASLGFFINPLMTVLLGVVVLGERVRPGQWVAIGLAAPAVLVVSVDYGHLPWYAWCWRSAAVSTDCSRRRPTPDRTSRRPWRQRSSLLLPWSSCS